MKRFDSTKEKYPYLFKAGCILTNFIHRRRMDMAYEVVGAGGEDDYGWDGDF